MRTSLLVLFIALLAPAQAFAKVAPPRLAELVQHSQVIVVARVESVTEPLIGKRYARARVTEVWKGAQNKTIEFVASPTWSCDISEAKTGETVLLFLTKSETSRFYLIAHSGRGRAPLRTVAGKSYATFTSYVILPKDTPTIHGPDSKRASHRSVELTTLRGLVRRASSRETARTRR